MANIAPPLQAGPRSTGRGLRVRVIVSLEKSFVRGIKAPIACTVAGSKRYGLQHLSDEGTISRGIFSLNSTHASRSKSAVPLLSLNSGNY